MSKKAELLDFHRGHPTRYMEVVFDESGEHIKSIDGGSITWEQVLKNPYLYNFREYVSNFPECAKKFRDELKAAQQQFRRDNPRLVEQERRRLATVYTGEDD